MFYKKGTQVGRQRDRGADLSMKLLVSSLTSRDRFLKLSAEKNLSVLCLPFSNHLVVIETGLHYHVKLQLSTTLAS